MLEQILWTTLSFLVLKAIYDVVGKKEDAAKAKRQKSLDDSFKDLVRIKMRRYESRIEELEEKNGN